MAAGEGDIAGAKLVIDAIKWRVGRIAPRRYGALMAAAQAEREEADLDMDRGMTVIVKRFTDVTPQDEAEADATEARYAARERGRGRGR